MPTKRTSIGLMLAMAAAALCASGGPPAFSETKTPACAECHSPPVFAAESASLDAPAPLDGLRYALTLRKNEYAAENRAALLCRIAPNPVLPRLRAEPPGLRDDRDAPDAMDVDRCLLYGVEPAELASQIPSARPRHPLNC